MATAVFFHAHPDDEAIATGGTMAKASAAGHRVVLVLATRGEHGEVPDGFLRPGESLQARRVEEVGAAAGILGVNRHEFLGYVDSGMAGTPENDAPGCFWRADVEEGARRLATILREEHADVLTIYDENGSYGHPDHIQVHRVGARAAELAGTPAVFESVIDRDFVRELMRRAREHDGIELPDGADLVVPEDGAVISIGVPATSITTRVDVRAHIGQKRDAMAAHASQISESSFFLDMSPEVFELTWGTECYIRRGAAPATSEDGLFSGLEAGGRE